MKEGARFQAAIILLEKILGSASPADSIVTGYFRQCRYMGSTDRRAISEMVYQILRRYEELKWFLQGIPPEKSGWARLLVFTHAYKIQRLSLEQIQELCQQDGLVKNIKAGSPQGRFDPAPLSPLEIMIFRQMSGLQAKTMPLWVRLNIPEWMLPRLESAFGPAVEEALSALNQPAPLDLRVNTLKTTRDVVLTELKEQGFEAVPTPWSPVGIRLKDRRPLSGHALWTQGDIEVQDEGSQLLGLLADAKAGMAVLDFCAGAGGKTLAMAAAMENRGRIVATDIAAWRLARARERVRRAGVNNVEFRALEDKATISWLKRQGKRYDRVLVDAPCSGSGTWRRNPDLKRRYREQDMEELKVKQQQILQRAAPFVRPGGRLVYATCSLFAEENREQVQAFLQANPDFTILPIEKVWQDVLQSSVPEAGDTLQLLPHIHQVDGFFIAVMERK